MSNFLLKKTLLVIIVILIVGLTLVPIISSLNNPLSPIKNQFSKKVKFNPFKQGWEYRKLITIDHNEVAGDLVNFPLLIRTIDSDLRDKAQFDGDDILFMNHPGKAEQLFHEIEFYDGETGELVTWVNIPRLSSHSDTKIYMYYGNPDCTNQEMSDSVWDSNYCSVWHLNDFNDSTVNGNHGINHGTENISGIIGKGKYFNSENFDYINWGDMSEPADNIINKATFQVWFNPDDFENPCPLIIKYNSGDYEPDRISYMFRVKNGKIFFRAGSGTWYPQGNNIEITSNNSVVTTNNWNYIVAVIDLATKNMKIYHNGILLDKTIKINNTPPKYFYDVALSEESGRQIWENSKQHLDGIIDEIRISKICRSPEWIITEYNNQNDVSNFLTFDYEKRPRTSTNENILIQRFFNNHLNILLLLRILFGID